MHHAQQVIDVCKAKSCIGVSVVGKLHSLIVLTFAFINLTLINKKFSFYATKINRLRERRLLNRTLFCYINVLDSSVQISAFLCQVSKLYISICVAGLFFD